MRAWALRVPELKGVCELRLERKKTQKVEDILSPR